MTTHTMTRTQDEIVARITTLDHTDPLTTMWATETLLDELDHDHIRRALGTFPEPTDENAATLLKPCDERYPRDPHAAVSAAREYLDFAIGKITNHRGISANRSVAKLREYAWLLGRDDLVDVMDAANYAQYGAPKVKAFADGMGWHWPTDNPKLTRMAEGSPCAPGCDDGCGQ